MADTVKSESPAHLCNLFSPQNAQVLNAPVHTARFGSPLGELLIAESGGAITGLWMEGQRYYPSLDGCAEAADTPALTAAKQWLDRYFLGGRPPIGGLPLAPYGSSFRRYIWSLLCDIPYGETVTYGALAKKLASLLGTKAVSAQAVGGAVGHNPISIIIPCHRVVGANGSLTGYAGGFGRKLALLELEGADTSSLFIPKTSRF